MGCVLADLRELSVSTPTSGSLLCSRPGRGEMAQDGGTRGGTFHGDVDRCSSKSQRWTTVCSSMPGRDGKHQGEDNLKQACSC